MGIEGSEGLGDAFDAGISAEVVVPAESSDIAVAELNVANAKKKLAIAERDLADAEAYVAASLAELEELKALGG